MGSWKESKRRYSDLKDHNNKKTVLCRSCYQVKEKGNNCSELVLGSVIETTSNLFSRDGK